MLPYLPEKCLHTKAIVYKQTSHQKKQCLLFERVTCRCLQPVSSFNADSIKKCWDCCHSLTDSNFDHKMYCYNGEMFFF